LYLSLIIIGIQGSVASIVTRLQAEPPSNHGSILGRLNIFPSSKASRLALGPSSYLLSMSWGHFPWKSSTWGMKLTSQVCVAPRLKVEQKYASTPPFVFMVCTGTILPSL
jgi:hypothetical protein